MKLELKPELQNVMAYFNISSLWSKKQIRTKISFFPISSSNQEITLSTQDLKFYNIVFSISAISGSKDEDSHPGVGGFVDDH